MKKVINLKKQIFPSLATVMGLTLMTHSAAWAEVQIDESTIWENWETLAREGQVVGNGGGVWICQPPGNRDVRNVHSLYQIDVFEAEREFQQTLPRPTGSAEAIKNAVWQHALNRARALNPDFALRLTAARKRNKDSNRVVSGRALPVIHDVYSRIQPDLTKCRGGEIKYAQIAVAVDKVGKVFYQKELYEALSAFEQAALDLHEDVYLVLRETTGERNSVRARLMTGQLLANMPTRHAKALFRMDDSPALVNECAQERVRFNSGYSRVASDGEGISLLYEVSKSIFLERSEGIHHYRETFYENARGSLVHRSGLVFPIGLPSTSPTRPRKGQLHFSIYAGLPRDQYSVAPIFSEGLIFVHKFESPLGNPMLGPWSLRSVFVNSLGTEVLDVTNAINSKFGQMRGYNGGSFMRQGSGQIGLLGKKSFKSGLAWFSEERGGTVLPRSLVIDKQGKSVQIASAGEVILDQSDESTFLVGIPCKKDCSPINKFTVGLKDRNGTWILSPSPYRQIYPAFKKIRLSNNEGAKEVVGVMTTDARGKRRLEFLDSKGRNAFGVVIDYDQVASGLHIDYHNIRYFDENSYFGVTPISSKLFAIAGPPFKYVPGANQYYAETRIFDETGRILDKRQDIKDGGHALKQRILAQTYANGLAVYGERNEVGSGKEIPPNTWDFFQFISLESLGFIDSDLKVAIQPKFLSIMQLHQKELNMSPFNLGKFFSFYGLLSENLRSAGIGVTGGVANRLGRIVLSEKTNLWEKTNINANFEIISDNTAFGRVANWDNSKDKQITKSALYHLNPECGDRPPTGEN